MITEGQIIELAEYLNGTCKSLEETLINRYEIEFDNVPLALLHLLDEQVLLCETCGWWSDSTEFDDDQICLDCRED